ncbi:hypothetical protein B4N89_06845 [Embleya scabrispora]|uniref:DUF4267 domain-containing protein n=1 Tax=Embleya scabrispora TaxID=159449 RepID=A0A1T3NV27_9ACTN|nr:hypothetical protein [Embleya scabrispora]OPC80713.1 hypothetical protein B4N89_06845 [Embleya scabrispora]
MTITAGDFDRLQRAAALAWGGARTALGVVALLDPPRVARPWIGDDADRVGALVFARALGGRDLALGVGTMVAAARGEPVRLWALTAAAADLGDVLITAKHARALPRGHRTFIATLAAGSALFGAALAITERQKP